MQTSGMNSDISVGNKRLHVQTSFSETRSIITANVFDAGRVIDAQEHSFSGKADNGQLAESLKRHHARVVEDIELLFYIADKVRQVKHPASCNKLGFVLLSRGFIDEAIAFFDLTISLDNNFTEAYNHLGECYLRKQDLAKAEEVLRKGLKVTESFADLHFNLGKTFIEKNSYADAVRAFDKALNINPRYYNAHYFLARALLHSLADGSSHPTLPSVEVRMERVNEHLRRAAELFTPLNNPAFESAQAALSSRNYKEALASLETAHAEVKHRMDLTFEHDFFLKFMYGGKGKDNVFIGEYVERLKRSITDYPEYADLHNNLGIAYLIMCRNLFLKALDEFRKALRINPSFKRAEKNLKLAENDGKGFLILLRALLK